MPPKKNGKKWTSLKTKNYYISNEISLRDLAKKSGWSESYLLARSGKENWTELKEQKNIKTISKVIEKASDIEAAEILDYLETNKLLHKKIKEVIKDTSDPKDLRALAGAIKDSHIIHRLEQGQSTENIQEETTNTNLNIAIEDKETYDKWTRLLNSNGK